MAQYRIPVEETFSWQRPIIDKDLNTPPVSPLKGDRYIVGPSPTGAWVGHSKDIAWCSNATGPVWSFDTPGEGWMTFVKDEDVSYYYSGTAWVIEEIAHAQQHAITSTTDHTSSATSGRMLKADANGLPVNATNTDTDVADAVTKKHANTLDHTQGTDTTLGTMAADIVMGTHQVTGLSVPDAAGEAIRQTTVITETAAETAINRMGSWDAGLGCILMTIV